MFWFHGLLLGKTWHPPRMVLGPDGAGGLVATVCVTGFPVGLAVGLAVACAVAVAIDDGDGVDVPARLGVASIATSPVGVGIAWADGPPQAVTTTSEQTRTMPSRSLVAFARSRITTVACPAPSPHS